MDRCTFCERPGELGAWLRRWPEAAGPEAGVRDARVRLCAHHLRRCVVQGRTLRRGRWRYG